MANRAAVVVMALVAVVLSVAGQARAQSGGPIVGWGSMVVVEPGALEGIAAIAGASTTVSVSRAAVRSWRGAERLRSMRRAVAEHGVRGGCGGLGAQSRSEGRRFDVAWGDSSYGQCNVPSPNTGFAAVAGAGGTVSV